MAVSVKCPKCHTDNPSDSKFCRECATPLPFPVDLSVTKTLETPAKGLALGSTFAGRYKIVEELGRGGMGAVYRAMDTRINEEVAIKLIRPEIAADEKVLERFSSELKLARKIAHKNVCRMFHLDKDEDIPYISMEYLEGEDLKSLIREKEKLPAKEAIGIAQQVCEGLVEAHRLGVIHRDLKPQNIMIDKDGLAKIMDFGIARSVEAPGVTQTGVIIGTPDYISPEQAEGQEADERSDIYSLGVIMYEMVTGSVPFKGDTALSVALKHKAQLPLDPRKRNPEISDDLSRLILICMEKDKARRYQTAKDLLDDLHNIEEGFPLGTKIKPRRKTFAAAIARKKAFIPSLAIVAVIIAVLIWKLLPRGELITAPKIENSIAVISFENLTGDPRFDSLIKAVPSLFITKFEAMEFSYVATLERLQDVLKQMGKDPYSAIDTETGFEVCRREGIKALVVGKITKAGDFFVTDIKVLDVETKKSLTSATSQGEGEDSILRSQIDDLSSRIAQKLGGKMLSAETVPAVSDITTSSMEAYEYYLKGKDALGKYYYDEALELFLRAVEIDPAFVMAHLGIANAYSRQGNWDARSKAMEKVIAHADRANPKEKLYIQGWLSSYVEDDNEKFYSIMKEISEKYPNEKEAHYWVGAGYFSQSLFDEAIKEFQTVLKLDPDYTEALNYIAEIYRRKGDLEKALEYAKRYVAAAPNEANPLDSLGATYCYLGQFDLAIAKFKEALSIKPNFHFSLINTTYAYALKEDYTEAIKWADEYIKRSSASADKAKGYFLKAFYEYWTGSYERALENAERARVVSRETQNKAILGYIFYLMEFTYREQGDFSSSRDCLMKAIDALLWEGKDHPSYSEYVSLMEAIKASDLGALEIREGKIKEAHKRLEKLDQILLESELVQKEEEKTGTYKKPLLGELLLAEGSFDKAIAILEQVQGLEFGFGYDQIFNTNIFFPEVHIAQAFELKKETDKAIEKLEQLASFDPSSKDMRLTPPKVYYNLGRLYEKKGVTEKAKENFEKFLRLWKDADPDIPEVEDAERRLMVLK